MREKRELLTHFGFTAARRRAALARVGLTAKDRLAARRLHERVIAPRCDEIVARFQRVLLTQPEMRRILRRGFLDAHLRAVQRGYLLSLGVDFESPAYFETRLRVGLAHARVGVPLSLYLAALSRLQRLIIDGMPGSAARGLAATLLKVTALDAMLATESYCSTQVSELERSVDALRRRASVLHRLAELDTFTGLASHAHIVDILRRGLAERKAPLSVIMADLDHFKGINDSHGHLMGDRVLRGVTARLQSAARRDDVLGRYGGDEFMVVLRNTRLATACTVAGRMHARVTTQPFEINGKPVHVTLSLGVAASRPGDNVDTLISRADAALYRAKQTGRNRVSAYPEHDGLKMPARGPRSR